MLRIAICEDDKLFRTKLSKDIQEFFRDHDIEVSVNNFETGESLLEAVNSGGLLHVMFLDVDLPGKSGVEVAREIRNKDRNVIFIFVTNFEEIVYKILDIGILSFIRKRCYEAEIDKILSIVYNNVKPLLLSYEFALKNKRIILQLQEVIWFEMIDRHISIHTIDQNYVTTYRSYKDLPFDISKVKFFFESYRGIYVNLNHTSNFDTECVYLSNNHHVYLARRKYRQFKTEFYENMRRKKGGVL